VDRREELAGLSRSMEDFCQRIRQGLEQATFEQKRKLVELLIDRVIVTDGEVEIRYVMPTSKSSENTRFCHLYLDFEQDHRGVKQRYYPMLGFQSFRSAKRFCPSFDELRNYFRPRQLCHQAVPAARKKEQFRVKVNALQSAFVARR
jgi:transposase-like protein